MALTKITFKPGINQEITNYTAEGGWYLCDKIRFRFGIPEKIGGWSRVAATTFAGVCRQLFNWITLTGLNLVAVGSTVKYYLLNGTAFTDITPFKWSPSTLGATPFATVNTSTTVTVTHVAHGLQTGNEVIYTNVTAAVNGIPAANFNTRLTITRINANSYSVVVATAATSTASSGNAGIVCNFNAVTLANNPITTVNGSPIVTIAHTSHGVFAGSYVIISGAVGFNGISSASLNKEFTITTVVDANNYKVTTDTNANASSAGGGAVVEDQFEIDTGLSSYVAGVGWGAGTWGSGPWGATTLPAVTTQLTTWATDQFGQDLMFNLRGGGYYYWAATASPFIRALPLYLTPGASDAPTLGNSVLLTDSQYVVALGCNQLGSATQDPLFVRWSAQANAAVWTPGVTNSSGGQRLSSGSRIIGAIRTKQEVLIFTDSDAYSMQYIGTPNIFGFTFLEHNISIMGPNVIASSENTTYWMGIDKFYFYNGRVQTLPCTLRRNIFTNLNFSQSFLCFAGTIEAFNEIIWFYPSLSSQTIDSYVIFNYLENVWYNGSLARTAWFDAPLIGYPLSAQNGYVLYHENGLDDGLQQPSQPIDAYIQSADFDLGDGQQFSFISRVIPDITFTGSSATNPAVTMTIGVRNAPGSSYPSSQNTNNVSTVTRSATVPVEQFTQQAWIRLRGRQVNFKIESNALGVQWQLGAPRIDIRSDGRR